MESGRYVSKEDPQRGGATMFKYNDADVRDLFNSIRYKRREDKANRAAKKSEVDGVLGKISEEVWKYDTEAYESEYNALMDRINNIYAENDKGDYYDIPFTKQIEIKKEISRLNQLADKSLQDKSNYYDAVKLAYQRLDDVDIQAFKEAAELEMTKKIGEKDFFNIMPLQKLEDVEYVKYTVKPKGFTDIKKDEELGGVVRESGKSYMITDNDYMTAWDMQPQAQKEKFASQYGVSVEDINKEMESGKLSDSTKRKLEVIIDRKGEESRSIGFTTDKDGGLQFNFGNGGGKNKNFQYQSDTTIKKIIRKTGDNTKEKIDSQVISAPITYNTKFNDNINYTGGYYNTKEGNWVDKTGVQPTLTNPNFELRKIPVNGDKKRSENPSWFFVDAAKAYPVTKSGLQSWAANKSVGITLEEAEDMLLDMMTSNAESYSGLDYNPKNGDKLVLEMHPDEQYYAKVIKGTDSGESTEDDNTNTGGAY
jgi:hypothetical protein